MNPLRLTVSRSSSLLNFCGLCLRHWLLAYRGAAMARRSFSRQRFFYARFIDSRGKLIATRSPLQLILLLIRESGAAGLARQRRFFRL